MAELLVSTFSRRNVVWSKANLELLKFKQFFIDTLNNHLELQKRAQKALGRYISYSTVKTLLLRSPLRMGLWRHAALIMTLNNTNRWLLRTEPHWSPSTKLMKEIDIKSFQEGKALYFTFGGRTTNKRTSNISTLFLLGEHYMHIKKQGYRYVIGRISAWDL